MRLSLSILVLLLIGLPPSQGGEIAGRVRVTKSLTQKRISLPQIYDRTAAALPVEAAAGAAHASLEDELKRVVVYLEGDGEPAKPQRAVVNQVQRRFEPDVVAVPSGSTIEFPNSDPIFHNVFSLSKAKQFDLGNYSRGKSRSITFDKPGVVLVHCHLHPNMSGAVVVTPNAHFVRPDPSGEFSLSGVAPGSYTLVAWHKSAGQFKRKIRVPVSGKARIEIEIPVTEMAAQ